MAPLGETALGLKFDSTLMTARTRLGSTLCREAAWSIAASISCCEKARSRTGRRAGDNASVDASKWFTSSAAERAARTLAEGTGFQRCSVELQNTIELCRAGACERLLDAGTASFT